MICIRLCGGLGNQMFQYACGRALSIKHQTELLLDCTLLQKNANPDVSFREYELDIFTFINRIATIKDLSEFPNSSISIIFQKLVWKIKVETWIKPTYFQERVEFNYNAEIEKISNKCYLIGNWQTPEYFINIEPIIREDFAFKEIHDQKNIALAHRINSSNSVSLHVRRGDYAMDLKTFQTHGLCSLDYYQDAINIINRDCDNPVYFIFSDDIEWTKGNIMLPSNHEYVTGNLGKRSYIDLQLMSLCKHNIIANSTFSWWGAWLNKNPNKIIVAPNKWFSIEDMNKLTNSLIPQTWKRI